MNRAQRRRFCELATTAALGISLGAAGGWTALPFFVGVALSIWIADRLTAIQDH